MSKTPENHFDEGRYHQLVEGQERLSGERQSLSREAAATTHLTLAQLDELLQYDQLGAEQAAAIKEELNRPESSPDLF